MSYSTGKRFITMKLESTPGVEETLADADRDFRAREITANPQWGVDDEASKYATGDYTEDESVAGTKGYEVSFQAKIAPSGTPATVEPKWFKPMKACGWKAVTYGTTGVALQDTADADTQTATIEVTDVARGTSPVGISDIIGGAFGNASISLEAGMPGMITFNFQGKHTSEGDVTNANLHELTGQDTSVAPAYINATSTLGGTAICVKSITIDTGNVVSAEICPSDETNIDYFKKDGQAVRCNINFLMPAVSVYGARSKFSSETVEELVISYGDFTITIPRLQLLSAPKEDASGSIAYNGSFKALGNRGANANLADDATIEILQGARA